MNTISALELKKIPYVAVDNVAGRIIPLLSFYDAGEWHFWFPGPNGLIDLKGEPAEGDYFAREAVGETDIYFNFLNFITQRAYWAQLASKIDSIRSDLHNLGASLGKLALFYELSKDKKIEVTRFVTTELEYIFMVCRSLFDLLQEVIASLWNKIELTDKSISKRQLPKSFRAMVMQNNSLMDVLTIQSKFGIPQALADFYYRQAPFFQTLRKYRDSIAHSGKGFQLVFVTEKGFAVHQDRQPFASFAIWNQSHMLPHGLASLRPAVAYVILQTFKACEEFSYVIQQTIDFPPEIAPGFKLFIRGYYNEELLKLNDVLNNCLWWDA